MREPGSICVNYLCDSVKDSRVADSTILALAKEHKVAGSFSSSLLPLNQRKPTRKVCIMSRFHRQLDVQISSDLVDPLPFDLRNKFVGMLADFSLQP